MSLAEFDALNDLIEAPDAINGTLSFDDVRVLPLLRSAAVVKGLHFPHEVRTYFALDRRFASECCRFEVPTPFAANSFSELQIENRHEDDKVARAKERRGLTVLRREFPDADAELQHRLKAEFAGTFGKGGGGGKGGARIADIGAARLSRRKYRRPTGAYRRNPDTSSADVSLYSAAGTGRMAIYRLLQGGEFDADAVKAMTTAYEAVLPQLGLADRADPLTEIVARTIIQLAREGERSPERLCQLTIARIRH